MDLWIRTQDKKRFMEVEEVYIESFEGIHCICTDGLTLGRYDTYERALQIIDAIAYKITRAIVEPAARCVTYTMPEK